MFDDQPPPRSKAANALIGLAMCICSFVVAVQLGIHTLCGPGKGYNSGGGSNADGVVFIIAVLVIIASAAGGLVCFVWLLVELTRGR